MSAKNKKMGPFFNGGVCDQINDKKTLLKEAWLYAKLMYQDLNEQYEKVMSR